MPMMNFETQIDIVTQKEIELPDGRLKQVAALVHRVGLSGPEVLLITSRGTGRWVLPKGWPQKGKSLARSALSEAREEAGVRGWLSSEPIGTFCYEKPPEDDCPGYAFCVDVFALQFVRQDESWPEQAVRELEWVTPHEAATRVAEADLSKLLYRFAEEMSGSRRAS
jgi:8-oxo-dGTP pyrophosphatase MutT (NUDIX family)